MPGWNGNKKRCCIFSHPAIQKITHILYSSYHLSLSTFHWALLSPLLLSSKISGQNNFFPRSLAHHIPDGLCSQEHLGETHEFLGWNGKGTFSKKLILIHYMSPAKMAWQSFEKLNRKDARQIQQQHLAGCSKVHLRYARKNNKTLHHNKDCTTVVQLLLGLGI